MKAAVLRGPYELNIEEKPIPKIKPGYVLINLKTTAICGTDVGIYKGKIAVPSYPVVQGHESVGDVKEIGEGVTGLKAGDRVIINPALFCRSCSYCFTGEVNLCPSGGLLGREFDGTFAEYVLVPEFSVIKIPDTISYEDASTLNALATVFRSYEKVSISPGESVAIIGQGAAGLLHTRMAVISGAANVYAITRSQWKLDIAKQYGADIINAGDVDPVAAVKEATNGRGVDLVVESVGSGNTLRQAMDMVRPGGTVLLFGIAPASVDNFNGYNMYFKEITLVGTRAMNRKGYENSVKVVEKGLFDLSPLITHRFDLEHTKDALDLVDKTPGKALRVIVNI